MHAKEKIDIAKISNGWKVNIADTSGGEGGWGWGWGLEGSEEESVVITLIDASYSLIN